MILADTSVWIDHFRSDNPRILELVSSRRLLMHPFVLGELSLGSLANRIRVLDDLRKLKRAIRSTDREVTVLIEREHLYGQGIGYIDAHLLTSALLTDDCRLWTRDKRLAAIAERLGVTAGFD
jgi:predicted nucleic acid-binding protein